MGSGQLGAWPIIDKRAAPSDRELCTVFMPIQRLINHSRGRITEGHTANSESPGPRRRAERQWHTAALLFLIHLGIYQINFDVETGGDATCTTYLPALFMTRWRLSVTPTSMPIMFRWHLNTAQGITPIRFSRWDDRIGSSTADQLRRSGELTVGDPRYYLTRSIRSDRVTGEVIYVNTFGPVPALLALPAFVVVHAGRGDPLDRPMELWRTAKFVASALVAGSVAFVYLSACFFTSRRRSILIAMSYGLGTCVWSVSSQALSQHPPNEFFLAIGTYLFLRSRQHRSWALGSGMAYALAAACRPTSVLVVMAVGAYLVFVDRRSVALYVLGGLPIAAALGGYQTYYHGSPFSVGRFAVDREIAVQKTGSADLWGTPLWEGLAGLLISPSRGLFVFTPFLLFALPGFIYAWKDVRVESLRPLTVAVVALVMVASKWFDWWGGWCFGYRPIVDTTPLLAIILVPVIDWLASRKIYASLFALLVAWSIAVQFVGAFAFDGVGWNARLVERAVNRPGRSAPIVVADGTARANPNSRVIKVRADIDQPRYRHRLWSFTDNQILYYIINFQSCRKNKLLPARAFPA
jgi:hypothetical protein